MKSSFPTLLSALVSVGLVAACSSSTSSSSNGSGAGGTNGAGSGAGNGTGSGSGTSTGSTTTPLTLEAKIATAGCTRLARCSALDFRGYYNDPAACVAEKTSAYMNQVHAPSASITDAQMDACVAALGTQACEETSLPAACVFTGTLADGAQCTHDTQCKSGACYTTSGSCGACTAIAALGADCSEAPCARETYCNRSTTKCVAVGQAGAPCTNGLQCVAGLICAPGSGGARTCTKTVGIGADCTSGTGGICNLGLDCVADKCAAEPAPSALGGTCGYDAAGSVYTGCVASYCGGTDENGSNGKCTAWPGHGDKCDDENGISCIDDSFCTNGICAYGLDLLTCN